MIQDVQALLATTLADCPTFQTFVGAADSTAALARIYHDAFPAPAGDKYSADELATIRPCALLWTPEDQGFVTEKDATDTLWNSHGSLRCWLYRTTPAGTLSAVAVSFRTTVGDLIEEIIARSESAGMLAARKIIANGPFRNDPTERKAYGDEQVYELAIDWGLR